MAGLYSHTSRTDGTILTADIYNADHQNHIDNAIPTMFDDYSSGVAQMRTQTDPGEVGTESLATSLAGEVERIRFAVADAKGTTYWYETPTTTLVALATNALLKTLVDAKGDLLAASAADTVTRLAVGTDSYVLTAASGEPTGLSWTSRAWMTYGARGIDCTNNSGTPNDIFDLDADAVVLYRVSDGTTVLRHNPGAAISCNVTAAGPAINGRDQAGAFSAGSWVHFYWIWNGTTLATVASATAPPTGPAMPSGYTHWAYAGTVRFNGSSQLVATRIKGARAYYVAQQSALANGTATSTTSVSLTTLIPPNTLSYQVRVRLVGDSAATRTGTIEVVSGTTHTSITTTNTERAHAYLELPNLSQAVRYYTSNAAATMDLDILSYTLPNGGE